MAVSLLVLIAQNFKKNYDHKLTELGVNMCRGEPHITVGFS